MHEGKERTQKTTHVDVELENDPTILVVATNSGDAIILLSVDVGD